MDGRTEIFEPLFTLAEVYISNPLFDSIEGTGLKCGPFNLLMRSQLLIELCRGKIWRRNLIRHTLGGRLVGSVTIHSPIIRTIAWMAIGRGRGRVAVVGHIVDGGQGDIRAAVWGWGCSSVMW